MSAFISCVCSLVISCSISDGVPVFIFSTSFTSLDSVFESVTCTGSVFSVIELLFTSLFITGSPPLNSIISSSPNETDLLPPFFLNFFKDELCKFRCLFFLNVLLLFFLILLLFLNFFIVCFFLLNNLVIFPFVNFISI